MLAALGAIWVLAVLAGPSVGQADATTISAHRIRDGIAGGWTGAVIAGAWGFPTEFGFEGRTVPARRVPDYSIAQVNHYTFGGESDESYVEIPFLNAMRHQGVTASWPQWGPAFARTHFLLFGANKHARANLRHNIPAPASGDPASSRYYNDIDFEIESDFIGMAAPAQPGAAEEIAWRLGHVMNYGDGVYGGVMVSAMHAAAFKARNVGEIVAAGQAAVPEGTAYRRMIDDVIRWHQRHPGDWKATWRKLERHWNAPTRYAKSHHLKTKFNIDAKLNGGYVLLGLLYGHGNFERTIRISMRAGQDSDCNPSNAASILGNWVGRSHIPDRFKRGLSSSGRFTGTHYTLPKAIRATAALARDLTAFRGGRVGRRRWHPAPSPEEPVGFEQLPLSPDAPPQLSAAEIGLDGRTVTLLANGTDSDTMASSGSDSAGIADVWWSFGDLSGAHGSLVQHTYRGSGTYRVAVWAADSLGRTSMTQFEVQIP
jgi:hypothetical protein